MTVGGKHIVVTGAGRGIGAELAAELRARGAKVVTVDIAAGADEQCDVSDADQVDALFGRIGAVDGLVNSAALLVNRRPYDEIPLDEWDRMFAVNVRGTFLCARAAAATMGDRGGSIVNVASETAFTGSHGFAHYVGSKGAVISLTRALANEMGKRNIRVNCVAPGTHQDARLERARRVRPEPDSAGTRDAARRPARDVLLLPVRRLRVRFRPDDHRQRRTGAELSAVEQLLEDHDATGLAELVRRGEVQPRELVEASIARIERLDPQINAVIHRQFERALADAAGAIPDGPFTGVPFLFKDFGGQEKGEPHQQGMRALRDAGWRAQVDSTLALRFRSLGFIPVGRTNLPELAMMGTTEPEAFGPTHNPWNLDRSPGGSSGGSGAAVAARYVPLAHANDIAGSIRIPASQCGLVGLKPTRGRVIPNLSFDAAVTMVSEGVVTRTMRDTAAVLDGIADIAVTGPWPAPALPGPLVQELGRDPGPLRIGLCLNAFTGAEVDEGCAQSARDAARLLESLGHRVEEAWPDALYEPDLLGCATKLAAVQGAAALDEWSTALGRTLGEADVEPATWSAISSGRAMSGTDVVRALERMQALSREVCTWWSGPDRDGFDLLLTPTTAEPGPELGAYKRGFKPGRGSAFTRVFNATGQPALSIPLGWPDDGLPRGVQLVAAYGREGVLIRVGSQLEQAAPWRDRRPPLG